MVGGTGKSESTTADVVVVSGLSELGVSRAVLALGVFDGVHLGHQAIVRELLSLARRLSAVPVALYFEPHPRQVLGRGAPARLCSPQERIAQLRSLGVRHFVSFPFTRELAGLSPESFFRRHLSVPGVSVPGYCVGWNWRFGCGNAGDGALLAELSGAEVRVVPAVELDGQPVSSTRIRAALADGRVEEAARLLGRPFVLSGEVTHGQHLGSTALAYPTANVLDGGVCLPAFGVYAARGRIDGDGPWHDGILYVGDAPTLRGGSVVVELHLFEFAGELYGHGLEIEFVSHIRGSVRFADAEALRRQIACDIVRAREVLSAGRG